MLKNLSEEYSLWSWQAYEILSFVRDRAQLEIAAAHLLNCVRDQHAKFFMASHFNLNASILPSKSSFLTIDIKKLMGDAFNFNFWNPNGHYVLNLSNKVERQVAICLFVMNKEARKAIEEGLLCDRSQHGNKSIWRSEKLNGGRFIVSNGKLFFDIRLEDPSFRSARA